MDRLIRLLRILTLIQNNPGIMAKELAERCETTERTIYRDLNLLDVAQFPISSEGHGKGYKFIGNFAMYPLDFTSEEAVAFGLLPGLLDQINQLVPPEFYSAYDKVVAAHKKEQKTQIENLQRMVDIIQTGTPISQEKNSNLLLGVVQAILHLRTLEVVYHTQSRDILTKRLIDPYFLIPRENRFYLIAYCHEKKKFLTFRMNRFHEVKQTDLFFVKQEFNIKEFFKNTWSIIHGTEKIDFKVLFNKNVARYIREEELFVTPTLTENEDGSLIFEITLNHDREFFKWVLGYGNDAEILEPVEYRLKMKQLLMEWMQKY